MSCNPLLSRRAALAGVGGVAAAVMAAPAASWAGPERAIAPAVRYAIQKVRNVEVFYREAGAHDAPVVLLLHGFPTSGHMFRDLIPLLADRYRVIAPDLPGFGNTLSPPRPAFAYTFDNLAAVVDGFVQAMKLGRYAIYIFDYGAPTGLRLALSHPGRVTAIVSQNGNAYVEGLSDAWGPFQTYWNAPTPANREVCRAALTDDAIRFQYQHGARPDRLSPDGYTLDIHYMHRPQAQDIQLDLILDYRSNVALYPTFQRYFREHRPPLLAVWGRHDSFFLPAGRTPTAGTCRTRRCAFSTPATSRSRPTRRRSARRCAAFWPSTSAKAPDVRCDDANRRGMARSMATC